MRIEPKRARRANCHRTNVVAAFALALTASSAIGAGFQINESSASGLGTAFAGGAAAAEDATTL